VDSLRPSYGDPSRRKVFFPYALFTRYSPSFNSMGVPKVFSLPLIVGPGPYDFLTVYSPCFFSSLLKFEKPHLHTFTVDVRYLPYSDDKVSLPIYCTRSPSARFDRFFFFWNELISVFRSPWLNFSSTPLEDLSFFLSRVVFCLFFFPPPDGRFLSFKNDPFPPFLPLGRPRVNFSFPSLLILFFYFFLPFFPL